MDVSELFSFIGANIDGHFGIALGLARQKLFQLGEVVAPALNDIAALGIDFNSPDLVFADGDFFRAAGREIEAQALFKQRGGNDENNQQDEGKVQEWSDIDLVESDKVILLGKAPHANLFHGRRDRLRQINDEGKADEDGENQQDDLFEADLPQSALEIPFHVGEAGAWQAFSTGKTARMDAIILPSAMEAIGVERGIAPGAGFAFAGIEVAALGTEHSSFGALFRRGGGFNTRRAQIHLPGGTLFPCGRRVPEQNCPIQR